MNYSPPTRLGHDEAQEIEKLASLFAGNDWAQNYIRVHKHRCLDDARNVLALGGAKVTNIGGAPYVFEALLQVNGLAPISIDLDPERHRSVITSMKMDVLAINIETDDISQDDVIANSDIVVLCEILEHLRIDLIGALSTLYKEMKPGALLYLTTPNFFYFRRFLKFMIERRSGPSLVDEWGKLQRLGHMGHVREYSKVELLELFEHVGFQVQSVRLRNRDSRVRKTILGFLPSLFSLVLERTFQIFGQEFVFVLRK